MPCEATCSRVLRHNMKWFFTHMDFCTSVEWHGRGQQKALFLFRVSGTSLRVTGTSFLKCVTFSVMHPAPPPNMLYNVPMHYKKHDTLQEFVAHYKKKTGTHNPLTGTRGRNKNNVFPRSWHGPCFMRRTTQSDEIPFDRQWGITCCGHGRRIPQCASHSTASKQGPGQIPCAMWLR